MILDEDCLQLFVQIWENSSGKWLWESTYETYTTG
jgi:hypothetical protein